MTQDQAARVADLPEEISLALTDIAVVAREGLQTMFKAEIVSA